MFGTENKAIQCDLTTSDCGSEVTQMLRNTKNNILNQDILRDSIVNSIRVFEPVHCSDATFAQDNEEVGGTKQEQNEQTISNEKNRSNESVRNEQKLLTGTADGSKASFPGDREVCFYF